MNCHKPLFKFCANGGDDGVFIFWWLFDDGEDDIGGDDADNAIFWWWLWLYGKRLIKRTGYVVNNVVCGGVIEIDCCCW